MENKHCEQCKVEKPISKFEKTREYYYNVCTACRSSNKRKLYREKHNAANSRWRAKNPASAIFSDSKKTDKLRGFNGFDLDTEYIKELISNGCSYCSEKELRITLDRIDNLKGHTKDNVRPSCIRCNLMRGSMPYDAWMHIAPSVKEARILGLFGDWNSKANRLK